VTTENFGQLKIKEIF